MITQIDLPKSMMAFKLQDGTMLYISNEDCKEIAMKVVVEGLLQTNSLLSDFVKKQVNLSVGIKELQQILEKYTDMDAGKRNEYFDVMVQLIKKANDL